MPILLRAYLGAAHLVPLVARRHLQKRLAQCKEHPQRWVEKLGQITAPRPAGTLIWLHAVGLGEVLALRGLITAMAAKTDAHFLITSSTLAGANVLAKNAPPRTQHQFLPLDAPGYRRAFLDHWQPDLCLWAEQDLWPGFVTDLAARRIPQAMIATRMTDTSFRKKWRFRTVFLHLYHQMALITAYDAVTAGYLQSIGTGPIKVTGSLKPAAPPLAHDADDLASLRAATQDRFIWITAPSHAADEALAIAAHKRLRADTPDALLIIAPRFPDRTVDTDLPLATRSKNEMPGPDHAVYLADTFGDLGLLYRLAQAALIGGTNDTTEGHSPWEAANLQTAILHGPKNHNFKADYATLKAANAATRVTTPQDLARALGQDMRAQIENATHVVSTQRAATEGLATDVLALL